jgi:serine/threonine protein kinase
LPAPHFHELGDPAAHSPSPPEALRAPFPGLGSEFLGFHLLADLGSGSFGRVYLATQGELADRYVALKVSTEILTESRRLAQLQHPHIVPVYSVHRAGPLQAVCMPYLGGTTLADLLREIEQQHSLPASGKGLVITLNDRKARTNSALAAGSRTPSHLDPSAASGRPWSAPPAAPAAPDLPEAAEPPPEADVSDTLHMLEGLTYVDAVLWIGARLADGLTHAHERGILHRDLKPANILLTDDGRPMLLDFNLSEDVKVSPDTEVNQIGGTLPYMAPEHLAAFAGLPLESAVSAPAPVPPACVDARSDLYSLGVVLYELLTGRHPFTRHPGAVGVAVPPMIRERLQDPPEVRSWNPAVSPAVESIIRHCLEPEPAHRYQSALELREDLERQLNNRPLRHAHEPSLEERLRKWSRRHPRLTSSTSVALFSGVIMLSLALGVFVRSERVAWLEAAEACRQFHRELEEVRFLSGAGRERDLLQEGRLHARSALEQIGFPPAAKPDLLDRNPGADLFKAPEAGAGGPPGTDEDPEIADAEREWHNGTIHRYLTEPERAALTQEVGEMLLLLAWLPGDGTDRLNPQASLRLNQLAAHFLRGDPPPYAVCVQRAELLRRLGRTRDADYWDEQVKYEVPQDFQRYLTALCRMHQRRHGDVLSLTDRHPNESPDLVATFLRGNCLLEGYPGFDHQLSAETAFETCLLRGKKLHAHYFRGIAHLRVDKPVAAVRDFTEALNHRPGMYQALVWRALAREEMGCSDKDPKQWREALADLDQAEGIGCRSTRLYLIRARIKRRLDDPAGARRDLETGLTQVPQDEESWLARGMTLLPTDPKKALADFEQAGRLYPGSWLALYSQARVLADHLDRQEEALARVNQALLRHRDFAPARAIRAVVHARLKHRTEALSDIGAAMHLGRGNEEILFRAAGVHALASTVPPENANNKQRQLADRDEALRLLAIVLLRGYGEGLLEKNRDLDPIRADPRFAGLPMPVVRDRAKGDPPAPEKELELVGWPLTP